MSATGNGDGVAFDAVAVVGEGQPERTAAQQQYLDQVADEAEAAVEATEKTIEDLEHSLTERRAVAEQARAAAQSGKVA